MSLPKKNLAAYTMPGGEYPDYISINEQPNGNVEVTVRGGDRKPRSDNPTASISLTPEQFADVEAQVHRARRNANPETLDRLTCEVEGDEIVIRLPLQTMAYAAARSPFIHHAIGCPETLPIELQFRVSDPAAFAREVVNALNDESEDGTTMLHELFDDAAEKVVEQGGEGFDWPACVQPVPAAEPAPKLPIFEDPTFGGEPKGLKPC